jgi:hypothetical protein
MSDRSLSMPDSPILVHDRSWRGGAAARHPILCVGPTQGKSYQRQGLGVTIAGKFPNFIFRAGGAFRFYIFEVPPWGAYHQRVHYVHFLMRTSIPRVTGLPGAPNVKVPHPTP